MEQLGKILFEKLQLPVYKKTKNGYTTDVEVLEKLKGQHPIIEKILEYRTLAKLNSTYVEGLIPYINPKTKRIHSSFHQIITATGRISSTEPNLQNIPTRAELGKQIRKAFKPAEGNIYIDGINIYEYSNKIYSSNVSITTQKPFIFNMSIRKNLDFVDTNINNQIEACKRVGIHDFIVSLSKGYNTILRENATNISGGQKQLISLARTLLSKSEILLFDEVTASLDPNTAKHVMNVLKNLKKDHTVIMITHKPKLMKMASGDGDFEIVYF